MQPRSLLRGGVCGCGSAARRRGQGEAELVMNAEAEEWFKAQVVAAILNSETERAIEMLCTHYRVEKPRIKVGVIEGRTKGIRAVYSQRRKEILAAKRDYFYDPFVMIHEFYHHLRSISGKHRGTERQADGFAVD